MKSKFTIILFVIALISGCSSSDRLDNAVMEEKFELSGGGHSSLKQLMGSSGLVLLFYSPECPLCVNYTRTIKQIVADHGKNSFGFAAVFPGTYYSAEKIQYFLNEYSMGIPAVLDTAGTISHSAKATVTPEAVVCDADGNVLYRGAIDDWAYAEGKKRPAPLNHYLSDALSAITSGKTPSPASTKPIGCFIE